MPEPSVMNSYIQPRAPFLLPSLAWRRSSDPVSDMIEDLLEEVAFRLGYGGRVGFGDVEEAERMACSREIPLGARVLLETATRAHEQLNSPHQT